MTKHGTTTTCTAMADIQAAHREDSRGSALPGASNWLHLAAGPTFAIMALLTAVDGSSTHALCSTMHDASPLNGMVAMYVLMSIFHSLPWLKLISSWRIRHARGGSYP